MKKWNVNRIAFDALLIALCTVLGWLSVDFGIFKLTFENLPVVIGAMMFGPLDGFLIGTIGTFFSQLLGHGLDATTVLWILPYAVSGIFVGLFRKVVYFGNFEKNDLRKGGLRFVLLLVVNSFLVTLLNTGSLYISYKYVWGMPTETLIPAIPMKLVAGCVRAVIFAIVTPLVIRALAKAGLYKDRCKA